MDEVLAHSMARASFCRLLLGISAFMALVLGIIGVYGVVSYVVTQRTQEMGVRIALGAGRRQLTRLVVGRGLALAVAGTGLGILAASALTRLMQTLLFGIDSSDPETVAASAILLTAVTMIASYVPARRAASVDPVRALAVE
jgi:ABC-type antimicrobial peptide transport system permease subunit